MLSPSDQSLFAEGERSKYAWVIISLEENVDRPSMNIDLFVCLFGFFVCFVCGYMSENGRIREIRIVLVHGVIYPVPPLTIHPYYL